MECYWIRNTEASLAELRRASQSVAVIPLASIESHGPHLPLGSDPLCKDYIVEKVLEQETVAMLPTICYSFVAAARMLPGAIHIRSELLMDMVENICDEVYRNGFDKVVLLHCHGGNVFLDTAFLRRMQEREKPYAVYSIPVLCGIGDQVPALLESNEMGHACEFETSLNMVACPELVNLEALGEKTFPTQPAPEVGVAGTPVDWTVRHPEMAVGFPQKATPEKGEKIAQLWADALIEHLRLIKKDKLCQSAMASYIKRANSIRQEARTPERKKK